MGEKKIKKVVCLSLPVINMSLQITHGSDVENHDSLYDSSDVIHSNSSHSEKLTSPVEQANHTTDGGIHGVRANQIQNGAYIIINDRPCKVVEASKSKPGKHGHSKCKFQGQDIFTGKKLEMSCQAQKTVSAPTIERKDYDLLDILEV